jgi:hypothetical protein
VDVFIHSKFLIFLFFLWLKNFHRIFLRSSTQPQNVQLFFFWTFVQNYVDWVLLHRKMLKTLYFKCFFTNFFEFFEKNDFFNFFKKMSKSCFGSSLTSNSERTSKIRLGRVNLTLRKLIFRKISKNKIFQFFYYFNVLDSQETY